MDFISVSAKALLLLIRKWPAFNLISWATSSLFSERSAKIVSWLFVTKPTYSASKGQESCIYIFPRGLYLLSILTRPTSTKTSETRSKNVSANLPSGTRRLNHILWVSRGELFNQASKILWFPTRKKMMTNFSSFLGRQAQTFTTWTSSLPLVWSKPSA